MGVRDAQQIGVELAGTVDVVGIGSLAGAEAESFLAAHRCADAEVAHEPASDRSRWRACATSRSKVLGRSNNRAGTLARRLYTARRAGGTRFFPRCPKAVASARGALPCPTEPNLKSSPPDAP